MAKGYVMPKVTGMAFSPDGVRVSGLHDQHTAGRDNRAPAAVRV